MKSIYISIFVLILIACTKDIDTNENPYTNITDKVTVLDASPQRVGDPSKGKKYLLNGDYVDSGIPLEVFNSTLGQLSEKKNLLNREGINADLSFEYTAVTNDEGIVMVSPNCFQCHAGYVDGEFILGLGNTFADFTMDQSQLSPLLDLFVTNTYGNPSPTWSAFQPFSTAVKATGPYLVTKTVGSNPADKLALILAAHRDQNDLSWIENPTFSIPQELYPVDVPPWWVLKKKNTMFSTAIGRGDFARLMMASSLLTLQDSSRARVVDNNFVDVKEYINTLTAPAYTRDIDQNKADLGKEIFANTCQKCHGNYDTDTYPNLLVDHSLIQTDEKLAKSNVEYSFFLDWYNGSWFAKGDSKANLVAGNGYIAPPLDGIWASAPYFHNGSVPTLWEVLNSDLRPEMWEKVDDFDNYDHVKMGLKYAVKSEKDNNLTYDTTLDGHGNKGHYFADFLSESDKLLLLEYLKTL